MARRARSREQVLRDTFAAQQVRLSRALEHVAMAETPEARMRALSLLDGVQLDHDASLFAVVEHQRKIADRMAAEAAAIAANRARLRAEAVRRAPRLGYMRRYHQARRDALRSMALDPSLAPRSAPADASATAKGPQEFRDAGCVSTGKKLAAQVDILLPSPEQVAGA